MIPTYRDFIDSGVSHTDACLWEDGIEDLEARNKELESIVHDLLAERDSLKVQLLEQFSSPSSAEVKRG